MGAAREWPQCEEDVLVGRRGKGCADVAWSPRARRVAVRVGVRSSGAGPFRPVGAQAAEKGACVLVRKTGRVCVCGRRNWGAVVRLGEVRRCPLVTET